jgi:tetratricopeptide (TPR) repeat protein
MSEARDPEEVRELLSRYFAVAQEVIGRYGGIVEKFIGDAVMAVWGTPTATESDVERAVRAALDLVDGVRELGRSLAMESLQARAGVVTGEVAVTLGATGQGMVAGDAVNTASRVQSAAQPGTVLVDEGTWRLARGAIEFLAPDSYELKGKANPVRLWQAQRIVSGVGGSQRVDGLEAPLVGRDTELRLIKEMFHGCADRRTPRLVSVTGPAGVGKSRLGWEFEKYVDGLVTSVVWHRGRCLSYGDGVSFWALAEMVRQRFGIAEEDPSAIAADKLVTQLPQLLADPAEREYVAPRLAGLLGLDSASSDRFAREELFAGWRLFFERLADAEPVVMLFEDLHYADAGLLDFLDHLLDWARDAPIFILTLARPEIEDRRPGWGAGRRSATALALEPLEPTAMTAMLDGLVPGMPTAARDSVAMQAQGMPLYAIETIRMLVDREAVQPIDGVYRLVGDLGELTVPDTLQSLLAARLDALPPDERRLVADAAVLGGSFPPEALAAVAGVSPDQISEALADLVRREVLEVKADPLSPNRGQYGFVQTMFRQVTYDTLSRRERKARHLAVADHLARAFADGGEEVSEVIANHLLDALEAVPDDPDTDEIRERAVTTLERAGERADRTGATASAVRAYTKAAELCEGSVIGSLSAAALLAAAAESAVGGDLAQATELFGRSAAAYRSQGDERKAARFECRAGRWLAVLGNVTEARRMMQQACAVLEDPVDEDTAMAVGELAWVELSNGLPDGEQLIGRALDLAQGMGLSDEHIGELLVVRGVGHAIKGRSAESRACYREALRMAEAAGDGRNVARISMNLCDLMMFNNPPEAVTHGRAAIAQCRRIGNRPYLATAAGNLLLALLLTEGWAEAAEVLAAGIADNLTANSGFSIPAIVSLVLRGEPVAVELTEAAQALGASEDQQDRAMSTTGLAYLARAHGDLAAAAAAAQRTIDVSTTIAASGEGIVLSWSVAADCHLAVGDVDAAARLLEWLDGRPVGHVPPLLWAERRRIDARIRVERGDPGAGVAMEQAVLALREVGSSYHLAVALLDHADMLTEADAEQAQQLADEARALAERLGAGSLSERLTRHGLAPVAVI